MANPTKAAADYWREVEATEEYQGASIEQKKEARKQWREQFGLDKPAAKPKAPVAGPPAPTYGPPSPTFADKAFNTVKGLSRAAVDAGLPAIPGFADEPQPVAPKPIPKILPGGQPLSASPPVTPITKAIPGAAGRVANVVAAGLDQSQLGSVARLSGRPGLFPDGGLSQLEGPYEQFGAGLAQMAGDAFPLGLAGGSMSAPARGGLMLGVPSTLRNAAGYQSGDVLPQDVLPNILSDTMQGAFGGVVANKIPGAGVQNVTRNVVQNAGQAAIGAAIAGQDPDLTQIGANTAFNVLLDAAIPGNMPTPKQIADLAAKPLPLGDLTQQRGSFDPRRSRQGDMPEGQGGIAPPRQDMPEADATIPPQQPPRPPVDPAAPTPPAGGDAEALAARLIENAQAQARGETLPELPRGGDQTPGDPNFQVRNVMDNEGQGRVMAETAKAFEAERDAAKRGVISDEQNRINAALLGMTDKQLQSRQLGKGFNAEEMQAAIDLTKASAQKAEETSKALAAKIEDGTITDAERLEFVESLVNHVNNQVQMEGGSSEVARALRVLQQAKAAKQKSAAIKRVMDQYGGQDNVDDMIKAISTLPPEQIPNALNKINEPTWLEALATVRKAGLMSGPKTIERNMTSGAVNVTLQEEWINLVNGSLDVAYAFVTGRDRVAYGASVPAMIRAGRDAVTKGASAWWQTVKNGSTDAALAAGELKRELDLAKKLGLKGWKATALNTVVNMPFRLSNDEIPRAYVNRRFLEGAARVAAINEAKAAKAAGKPPVDVSARARELVENPTEVMALEAMAEADRQTYNNANALADKFAFFDQRHRDTSAGQAINFLRNQVQPFVKVPINWYSSQVLDQTGLRPLFNMLTSDRVSGRKDFSGDGTIKRLLAPLSDAERKAVYRAVGTSSLGVAQYMLGQYLAKHGMMTGLSLGDSGDRSRDEEAGVTRGAININGEWRQIGWLFPVMVLGASMHESGRVSKRWDKQLSAAAGSLAGLALEHPAVSGIRQTVKAMENPLNAGERWVSSQVGSFVPTAVSDLAALTDDRKRVAESWYEGVMMRTPGLRQMLPEKTTAMGQPVAEPGSNLIDIFRSSPDKTGDPVIGEIVRVGGDIARQTDTVTVRIVDPDSGVPLRVPVRLEPEERNQINRRAGELMNEAMLRAIDTPNYRESNTDKQKLIVDTLWKKAKSAAKQEFQAGQIDKLRAKADAQINAGHGQFLDAQPQAEETGAAAGQVLMTTP